MILNLFYPASYLSHKNHFFLEDKRIIDFIEKEQIQIILTIENQLLKINSKNFQFIGKISNTKCMNYIRNSSAILFLSSYESLGLPILEACMHKKSLIVPKLSYSEELIGDSGYYLEYPLNCDNFIQVIQDFKYDFIHNSNKIAKLMNNFICSEELISIFLNKLNCKI